MDQDKTFLGTEPVGKLLLKLAVPTVIAQLVNMLYNIVDRIYIGHMPGDGSLALTGVGVCMPIILAVSAFSSFSATGGAPRASIIVAVMRKLVLLLPLIYIMPQLIADKTSGVYTAEPVADIIAVCFTAVMFSVEFKKAMKALEDKGAEPA